MALQTLSLQSDAYMDYSLNQQELDSESKLGNESLEFQNIRVRGIRSLMVKNFKSFQNEHYIGPFTDFTGVIGPNGGGKSNILDAISFALGLTIRDLRCQQPQDLIYQSNQYSNATVKKKSLNEQMGSVSTAMYVEIVFSLLQSSSSSSSSNDSIQIRRCMSESGDHAVFINGQQTAEEDFAKFMLNSKIHITARNFIMLQGEAEVLSIASPMYLTELFERMSGSIQYKREYNQLIHRLDRLQREMREYQLQRAQLKSESRKLKELIQTSKQYKILSDDIIELRIRMKLVELYVIDQDVESNQGVLGQIQIDQQEYENNKHSIIIDIQKCDMGLKMLQKSNAEILKQIKQKQQQLQLLDQQDKQCQLELMQAQSMRSLIDQKIDRFLKVIDREHEMLNEIEMDMQDTSAKLEFIDKQANIQIPEQWLAEYKNLQEQFQQEHFQLQSQIKKTEQQQQMLTDLMQQSDFSYKQIQIQLNEQNTQLSIEQQELNSINQSIAQYRHRSKLINDKLIDIDTDYQNQQSQIKKLQALKTEKELILQNFEYSFADHIEEQESKRIVQQLTTSFPKFIGELSCLINPISQQWASALKVALGQKMLCSLIVQDTQSVIQLNKFLKSISSIKDVMILDKVKHHDPVIDSELRNRLEAFVESYRKGSGRNKQHRNGRGILAIDALEYDKNIEDLITYLVRGTILTDSYQLAVDIQKAQINGVFQVITQDGVQLQQGMIVAHQRLDGIRNFRNNNQKTSNAPMNKEGIQKMQRQLEETIGQIKNIKQSRLEEQVKELQQQKIQLEEQITATHVQFSLKERLIKQINESNQPLIDKSKILNDEIQHKQLQLSQINDILQSKNNEILQLRSKFYQKFLIKTGMNESQLNELIDSDQLVQKKDKLQTTLQKLQSSKDEINQRIRGIQKNINEHKEEIRLKSDLQNSQARASSDIINQSYKIKDEIHILTENEAQIQHKIKQQGKILKDFMDQRDELMKNNINLVQNRTLLINKLDSLLQDKQKLIEECEMESIEITFKQIQDENRIDRIIDYTQILQDLDQQDPKNYILQLQKKIELKEKDVSKYLSENLQLGLIGGKSDQKIQEISTQINILTEKLNELYEQETQITDALRSIKELRAKKFNDLFHKVSDEINSLYRSLTLQDSTKLGGSALLYLENQQEPFNAGVIYTTTPPNKKYVFDTSEQLSGGEKTMASLALMFALNSALGTPFILLDEIDANLDPDNSQRLRLVIQALQGKPTQFIIISHNSEVYGKAQSLIGVTIQKRQHTSEAFSMLL